MPKLKEVRVSIRSTDRCILEDKLVSFNEMRDWMNKVEKEHPEAINMFLDVDAGHYNFEVEVYMDRLETQEEYSKRLEKNRKNREIQRKYKERIEEQERNLLTKLKAKYNE